MSSRACSEALMCCTGIAHCRPASPPRPAPPSKQHQARKARRHQAGARNLPTEQYWTITGHHPTATSRSQKPPNRTLLDYSWPPPKSNKQEPETSQRHSWPPRQPADPNPSGHKGDERTITEAASSKPVDRPTRTTDRSTDRHDRSRPTDRSNDRSIDRP